MIERFEDDVDGLGELEIAETCEERIRLIRQRQVGKEPKQNGGA